MTRRELRGCSGAADRDPYRERQRAGPSGSLGSGSL